MNFESKVSQRSLSPPSQAVLGMIDEMRETFINRAKSYGNFTDNNEHVAQMAKAMFGGRWTAAKVCLYTVLIKLGRICTKDSIYQRDHYIDAAVYMLMAAANEEMEIEDDE